MMASVVAGSRNWPTFTEEMSERKGVGGGRRKSGTAFDSAATLSRTLSSLQARRAIQSAGEFYYISREVAQRRIDRCQLDKFFPFFGRTDAPRVLPATREGKEGRG